VHPAASERAATRKELARTDTSFVNAIQVLRLATARTIDGRQDRGVVFSSRIFRERPLQTLRRAVDSGLDRLQAAADQRRTTG